MLREPQIKTTDEQKFGALLEKLNGDIVLACEVWMTNHSKIPDQIAAKMSFDNWQDVYRKNRIFNQRLSRYTMQKMLAIGDIAKLSQLVGDSYITIEDTNKILKRIAQLAVKE